MKANKATRGGKHQTTGEERTNNQRVALIQLHRIKSLSNKKPKWQESPHTYPY
jgi:hypothetical protein